MWMGGGGVNRDLYVSYGCVIVKLVGFLIELTVHVLKYVCFCLDPYP